MSIFTSFNNPRPQSARSKVEAVEQLVMEQIAGIKARRREAEDAENRCEASLPTTREDEERYEVLRALLEGPHRPQVVALLLEHFPELVKDRELTGTTKYESIRREGLLTDGQI